MVQFCFQNQLLAKRELDAKETITEISGQENQGWIDFLTLQNGLNH